jgi:YggT family protein
VGGSPVILLLLADAASSIQRFVDVFVGVYILLVFAYVLLSWIRLPYSSFVERVRRFLFDICDPYLRLFRRFIPPLGPLDLSPIVAIFALIILQRLVNALIGRIL